MSSKNYSLAFQIAAAFNGAKAFTDATAKLADLNSKIKTVSQAQIDLSNKYISGGEYLSTYATKMAKLNSEYDKLTKKQKLYSGLVDTQAKFESSFSNMSKYAVNTYQYKEMGNWLFGIAGKAQDFEAAMSKVQAITGSTNTEMKKLEEQALELGKKSKFSASESAEAMTYLGMAGWKTGQIMAGMPGLLNLAAASGESLATTADIVSDDLTAFKMSADQAGRMADVMAAASSNANTNVAMMGQTFKYAGAVAGSLGYRLEDVAIATGLMANAGIKADQAGTSLRAIMTRLVKPPKEAAKAINALSIKITDSKGNIKPFATTIEELRAKFKGLSKEEKAQRAAQIAGQEAMSGFLSLIDASDDDFAKLTNAINNSNGAAKRMAETMSDNAKGKIVSFQSAFESLQIAIGKNFIPAISMGMVEATKFIDTVGSFAKENPAVVNSVTAFSMAVIGLGIVSNGAMWVFNGLKAAGYGMAAAYKFATVALIENNVAHKAWLITKAVSITALQVGSAAWQVLTGKMTLATAATRIMTVAQWAMNTAWLASPIGATVTGITLLVGAIMLAYNNIDYLRVKWTMFWVDVKNSYPTLAKVFEGIWTLISGPYKLICAFVNKVKELIGLGPTAADNLAKQPAISNNPNDYEHNATGGIYNKGAFLTTFAENSGESAIPHTPNAHNIGLLAKTNEIMGNPLGGQKINATFSPNITIQGAGDTSQLQQVLENEMDRFKKMLQELQNQQRRLSYA